MEFTLPCLLLIITNISFVVEEQKQKTCLMCACLLLKTSVLEVRGDWRVWRRNGGYWRRWLCSIFCVKNLEIGGHRIFNSTVAFNLYHCQNMFWITVSRFSANRKQATKTSQIITLVFLFRRSKYADSCIFCQQEEAETNAFSFSIAGRACASIGSHTTGRQIHAAVIKQGYESNTPVMNSILDMYCRCDLREAKQCFHGMTERDLITWNTWIAGYEKSDSIESLYIFSQMEYEGFSPNCFTLSSVVAACSNLAVLNCGQQVHGTIIQRGFDRNLALSNALIDMYAKCGNISDSQQIFIEMSIRDLVSWTSMMIGYGSHGYGKEAVELFDQMVKSGIRPDRIVFMAVLGACSHAGLVDKGLSYFNSMIGYYNLTPNQEIYGCVVDLLGRAGRVKEAYEIMEGMPFKPDESVWGAFLGACKAHRHPDMEKLAARRLLDLGPNMAGTYVTVSNIYAAEGMWGDFAKVRKLMRGVGSRKEAGRSWVQVRNQVCGFVVGDKVGAHIEWVYEVLDVLVLHMVEAGYVPDLDCLTQDLEDGT